MTSQHVKHKFLAFSAAVFMLLILALGYFSFLDGKVIGKPITFPGSDPQAIKTDKLKYKRGEIVYGYLNYCKHRNVKTFVQWSMIDGMLSIFPTRESAIGKGCKDNIKFEIERIPVNAVIEEGIHFEGVVQYQVNPFSVITVPLKTEEFEIIK